MKTTRIRLATTTLVLAAIAASSQAVLINPSGGAAIFTGGGATSYDDSISNRALGGTFSLFGTSVSALDLCVNGNMTTGSSGTWTNAPFPATESFMRIGANWDDLYVYSGTPGAGMLISDKSGTGYYAATWQNVGHISNSANQATFQIAMFNAATNIGGFNFQAGDIAFSYDSIATVGTDSTGATIGVNNGVGGFAVLPGTTDGVIHDSTLVPMYPASGQFVLFRWGGNNYTASIQAVPEPASMSALALGALALLRRRRSK